MDNINYTDNMDNMDNMDNRITNIEDKLNEVNDKLDKLNKTADSIDYVIHDLLFIACCIYMQSFVSGFALIAGLSFIKYFLTNK